MNKLRKHFIIFGLALLALPLGYLIVAITLSQITVPRTVEAVAPKHMIYLGTNGVHLDITLAREDLSPSLEKGLILSDTDKYFSFGWGEENFYLNTPRWADLTVKTAVTALLVESNALMHVTRYKQTEPHWLKIPVTKIELQKINQYLQQSFDLTQDQHKQHIAHAGYTAQDDFYKATGSYSMAKTCNTWVNEGFKTSGLKASFWTPFDFGLINKYN